jgi:glycosylphosphatidylinositol transamidase
MAENKNVTAKKPRVRPIVRLGIFLISHSNYVRYTLLSCSSSSEFEFEYEFEFNYWINNCVSFFSLICFVSGIVALLLLPILAKNTYVSENALMPGSILSLTFPKSLLFLSFYLLDTVT